MPLEDVGYLLHLLWSNLRQNLSILGQEIVGSLLGAYISKHIVPVLPTADRIVTSANSYRYSLLTKRSNLNIDLFLSNPILNTAR